MKSRINQKDGAEAMKNEIEDRHQEIDENAKDLCQKLGEDEKLAMIEMMKSKGIKEGPKSQDLDIKFEKMVKEFLFHDIKNNSQI